MSGEPVLPGSWLRDVPKDGQPHMRVQRVPVWWIRCTRCGDGYGHPAFGEQRGREAAAQWLSEHGAHCRKAES